ncbi:MAG: hypothetical protein J5582_07245 [Ruminococcus sp.]|uniref:Transmembrane protein n=1 Tax=Ruminococcus albus TaxID=1264 RepID=A0A1I1R3S2_RUMAL|nr:MULTISPECIES: hypothetical protein [Ruminococcus]MBO4866354.1 hypothetical protein [Ruminococcus sp.]SFD29031.1 hypothetical protein SAMN02910406_03592 [Ruminococcus albus]
MKEKITETVREIIDNEVKTPSVGYFWKGLALFLFGVIIGFTFAPIKKGIKIGCNNGNNCTDSGKFLDGSKLFTKKDDAEDEEDTNCGNFCAD